MKRKKRLELYWERDYTIETEDELRLVQSDINSFTYNFMPTTNGTGVNGIYNSWSIYNTDDANYYANLFSAVSNCFENVRNFDATYTGLASNLSRNDDETLDGIKTVISGIRDCMKIPSNEVGPMDIYFYKNTIFGDEYASVVVSEGLEDMMLESNSVTATKYFFDQIISVNEDGSIRYDMNLIMKIMDKSADEINSGQYDAIALAYTNMTEEEITQLMCACTYKVEDYKYGFNIGIGAGAMNEDYSSWKVDQQKCANIYNSLSSLSDDYLITCCIYNEAYKETQDETYKIKINECENTRKELLQRMALWGSFGTIDEIHGEYQGDKPIITVESVEYGGVEERYSYVLTFAEYRNVGSSIAPVFTNFGNSTITVNPCMEEEEITYYQTSLAEEILVNHFVPGFTPSGYEGGMGQYIFESIVSGGSQLGNDYIFNQFSDGVGYVNTVAQSIFGSVMDYQSGVEGATVIESTLDEVEAGAMYKDFGFYCVPVVYDMAEGQVCTQYANPGTETVELIVEYNKENGTDISILEVMYHPEQVVDEIKEYYGYE